MYTSLQNIDLSVMEEIAVKYKVPIAFVQSKFDDILEYINSNKKQDLLNKLIGRDQPTSLNKYRKFD